MDYPPSKKEDGAHTEERLPISNLPDTVNRM
jgi:hypothetical protein